MNAIRMCVGVFFLAFLLQIATAADTDITVTAVQPPAWLYQAGRSQPLTAGMRIAAQDQIRTGADARVILSLPDASTVKLGQHVIFNVADLQAPTAEKGVLIATLEILQGAFRFTSTQVAPRDITLKIDKSIVAGIRGTDVWGAADNGGKDMICLLEGKIAVTTGTLTTQLTDPRQFVVVPRGGTPTTGLLDEAQLKKWMAWTELKPEAN